MEIIHTMINALISMCSFGYLMVTAFIGLALRLLLWPIFNVWTYFDWRKATPLHLALAREYSDKIVLFFLRFHREAPFKNDDQENLTPLHVATRYKNNAESAHIIHQLIIANPMALSSKSKLGFLPLHVGCQHGASEKVISILIHSNPNALVARTISGDTPLHIACRNDFEQGVIQMLVSANVQMVNAYNYMGETPFSIICQKWEKHAQKMLDLVKNNFIKEASDLKSHHLYSLWGIMCHFALVSYSLKEEIHDNTALPMKKQCESRFLLHASVSAQCPPSFIQFILKIYPEQALQKDMKMRVPLAIAALQSNKNSFDIITILIEAFPEAAKIPNEDGSFPLHFAISSGKGWNLGVEKIFLAAPEVLSIVDPCQSLSHFAIAAISRAQCLKNMMTSTNICKTRSSRKQSIAATEQSFDHFELTFIDYLLGSSDEWMLRCWDEDIDDEKDLDFFYQEDLIDSRHESSNVNGTSHSSLVSAESYELESVNVIFNLLLNDPSQIKY